MKAKKLSHEDRQLWESLTQTITPLDRSYRVQPVPVPLPSAFKREHSRNSRADLERIALSLSKPVLQAKKRPTDRGSERRIRRGQCAPEAVLDLHGHTLSTVRPALSRFVAQARERGYTCILVITGKGRQGGGILRSHLPEMLAYPDIACHVGGYAWAHQRHGGDGACYLFLRAARKNRGSQA